MRSGAVPGRAVATRKPLALASRRATTASGPTAANRLMAIAAPDCTEIIASTVAATPVSTEERDPMEAARPGISPAEIRF